VTEEAGSCSRPSTAAQRTTPSMAPARAGPHGVDVDHREIMGALEPLFADRPGYRRLGGPGMARSDRAALERTFARWR
jgi:hypothetical protein